VAVAPKSDLPEIEELLRRSRELEKLRQQVRARVGRVWMLLLAGTAALYLAVRPLLGPSGWYLFPAAILVLFFWALLQTQTALRPYHDTYKREVLGPLVEAVLPGFRHDPGAGLSREVFLASRLFPSRPDRYHSEDLFSGRLTGVPLSFAEVRAEEKREDCDKEGCRTRYLTIFKGLLAVAEFPKSFQGTVLVYPDRSEKLLGALSRGLQNLGGRFRGLQLIKLEDPVFERHFVAYADDPVTARYVLSTRLMETLSSYRERYGPIYVSFVDGTLYLALPYSGDAFEPPPLWRAAVDVRRLRRYADLLQAMRDVVSRLQLDVRIWGERALKQPGASGERG